MADEPTSAPAGHYSVKSAWRLFARLFVNTGRSIITAPAKFGVKGWVAVTLVIISAILALIEKRPIQSFFSGDPSSPIEFFASIGQRFGDYDTVVAIIFFLIMLGLAARRNEMLEAGIALAVAGLYCGLITLLGQFFFAEARPESGGQMLFLQFHGHGVSGHASSAAVLFWPIYSVLGQKSGRAGKVAIACLLITWAILVAWSRMWDDKHFLWNVILGVSVGFITGYLAVREWKRIENNGDMFS